jgi:hypothetical protein
MSLPLSSAIAAAEGGLGGVAMATAPAPELTTEGAGLSAAPQNSQNIEPSGKGLPHAEQVMEMASIPQMRSDLVPLEILTSER